MKTQNIPVEKLFHHPQNPRKEIGDITELADSVKAKGILQNLTVVPAEGGYYVVIGNRRLEAAKKAGLTELPCVVAEMTEKEQMETMLLENIQRVDLTVKEQADGFQMMINLGTSVEELSEKTGFAKSTIYHRLNIAKLDPKIVDEKQLTLKEMILLEKVKSIEKRNELLKKYGGTANFEYYVNGAAQDEERAERKKQIIEALKLAGIPESEKYTYKFDPRIEIVQEISALNKAIPEIEQGEFYITTWNGVIIANEKPEAEETPEEAEAKAKEAEMRARRAAASELNSSIEEKITQVIGSFIFENKELDLSEGERKILALIATQKATSLEGVISNLHRTLKLSNTDTSGLYDTITAKNADTILLISCIGYIGFKITIADYYNKYVAEKLEIDFIEILKRYGLILTPPEEALIDGTSELYEVEDEVQ